MPSTVTTSTIAAITAPLSSVIGLTDFVTILTAVSFVALLIRKEMVSIQSDERSSLVARGLNIILVPLGYAFVLIGVDRLLRALS
jgi:hypothetical protein